MYKNKDEDKGCSLKDIVEGLKGASIRKLTEEEKANLEGEIGSFEAGKILKKMKNNKSPGSDGLGYWTRAIKRFALFDLLKSLYSDTNILSKYIPSLQKKF